MTKSDRKIGLSATGRRSRLATTAADPGTASIQSPVSVKCLLISIYRSPSPAACPVTAFRHANPNGIPEDVRCAPDRKTAQSPTALFGTERACQPQAALAGWQGQLPPPPLPSILPPPAVPSCQDVDAACPLTACNYCAANRIFV